MAKVSGEVRPFEGLPYVFLSRSGAQAVGRAILDGKSTLPAAVLLIAAARMGTTYHAPFAKNELLQLAGLYSDDKRTRANNQRTLYRAIGRGIELGLFGEGSGVRCVLLHGSHFEQRKGSPECKHHGVGRFGEPLAGCTELWDGVGWIQAQPDKVA